VAGTSATPWFALLALASAGCLLYTDPVNTPPRLSVEVSPGDLGRGSTVLVKASVADDEDSADELASALQWRHAAGKCPLGAPGELVKGGLELRMVLPNEVGPVCVHATVTDRRGATASAEAELMIVNHAPTAAVRVLPASAGKVRLYARIELSGIESRDLDTDDRPGLTFTWSAVGPAGQAVDLQPCDGLSPPNEHRCFWATLPGHYDATLTVDDRLAKDTKMVGLDVEQDLPPCLLQSNPGVRLPITHIDRGDKRTFEALEVDDDGEPFPRRPGSLDQPEFVWSRATDGGQFVRLGPNDPRLDVSEATFGVVRPGDQPRLRLEVRDKLREDQLQRGLAGPPCPDTTDVCEQPAGCVRWTTWRVQFDP